MNDRLSYRIHTDLLAQVATSAEEEREVRRVLYAPLTESDLDANEASKRAACSGPCEQGRKKCATPEACQLAAEDYEGDAIGVPRVIGFCLAFWAVVAALLIWSAQ